MNVMSNLHVETEKDSLKYARQVRVWSETADIRQLQHVLGICKSKLQTLRQSQSFSRQYKAVHRVWRARGCMSNTTPGYLVVKKINWLFSNSEKCLMANNKVPHVDAKMTAVWEEQQLTSHCFRPRTALDAL
ncbi:Hypothetical predicted protein [Cloeon dipterum]|uniref:Uncharacterized protein n=1 Tax=Cloeon dipterum TaxID=197152 RepID=A0A8S1DXX4_9INSE|nr:Hypothetical predicted protein [Cloeon dipterum]